MNRKNKDQRSPSSCLFRLFLTFVGIAALVFLTFMLYRPDQPVPAITPGTSTEPTFVVQVIRPRQGLPFGGLIPPEMFGVDAELRFDSESEGAETIVGDNSIELSADNWKLKLVFDDHQQIMPETEIVFRLVFEDQIRTVRCRPGDPPVGTFNIIELNDSKEQSGSFDLELPICEDAETGKSLGWPPQPLILHGSFDRLAR